MQRIIQAKGPRCSGVAERLAISHVAHHDPASDAPMPHQGPRPDTTGARADLDGASPSGVCRARSHFAHSLSVMKSRNGGTFRGLVIFLPEPVLTAPFLSLPASILSVR